MSTRPGPPTVRPLSPEIPMQPPFRVPQAPTIPRLKLRTRPPPPADSILLRSIPGERFHAASTGVIRRPPAPQASPLTPQTAWTCRRLTGHTRGVSAVRFHPGGKALLSAGADRNLIVWDVAEGRNVKQVIGHGLGINDLRCSSDGRYFLTVADDCKGKVWDASSVKKIGTLKGHTMCVFSCGWNIQGNMVATGGEDGSLMLWDVRSGRAVRSVTRAHFSPVSSVEFHRDASIVLTASTDGLCRIWDVSTGNLLKTLVEQKSTPVGSATFSPNGRYILASHMNGTIKMTDYLRNKAKKIYQGHVNDTYCISSSFLTFTGSSGTGAWIVSGSEDHKVYIWDVSSRRILHTLEAHTDAVISTACHPFSPCIASGGLEKDRQVCIWTPDFSTDESSV